MERVKLKDLCTMKSGGTPSRSNLAYWNNGYLPWAKISDLETSKDGFIYDTEEKITDEGLNSINNRWFKKGTLLLAMYGSVGKTAISKIDLTTNQAILGIEINDPNKLDINYLRFWFQTIKAKLMDRAVGAALLNISLAIVKDLQIPLPDLATQKAIAAKLDKADEIRQLNKKLIEQYDALTQSLFLDMFGDPVKNEKGWEKIALEKICHVGSSKRVFVDQLKEEGIPFYRGTEVGALGNGEEINPSLFISKEHYEKLKVENGIPEIGDLLMPSICPDGRIFEVTESYPFYYKDGRVLWISNKNKKINSTYLKKYLKAEFATNYGKIASGTTFAELKIFALKSLLISFPPLTLQNEFAERVKAIEAQKTLAQQALQQSENLFNSLLQESFQ